MIRTPRRGLACLVIASAAASAHAQVVFSDDFSSGPSPMWSNFRGDWRGSEGGYDAFAPTNSPCTATLLPFVLQTCEIEMDIRRVSDGGVWMNSTADTSSSVLLVTGGGGHAGRGFYWHTVANNSFSGGLNNSGDLFNQGDDIHIRVTAEYGNASIRFACYLNGSPQPATELTVPMDFFPTDGGQVGLYDFTTPGQVFDNVVVRGSVTGACPADFNDDGFLDFFDADAYVQCFEGDGCPPGKTADFNGDGFPDFFDYAEFIAAFEAGC